MTTMGGFSSPSGILGAMNAASLTDHVGCRLRFVAAEPSRLALAVAVADSAGDRTDEELTAVRDDGEPVAATEIPTGTGGRIHLVDMPTGPVELTYRASVATRPPAPWTEARDVDEAAIIAMRQSRYCPSDELEGFASATFDAVDKPRSEVARAIADWVFAHIRYEVGTSGPLDTAVDTLLASRGVCRDFAHLTITLCRALGIPARLAAVYAPGLTPMDFHAVVEVRTEHGWEVVDSTRLAPRQSLVRIATGRDAADTAFATTLRGDVALELAEVLAVVEGDLPSDDHQVTVTLG
ncbi:MAG: transglutaminase-like domain-containing protein [Acidimicrobiales bacterium]